MILFLLSGQYFRFALDGLQGLEDAPRLLLRTSHVNLFFASFINIVFGMYYVQPARIRWYTLYNQSLLLASPLLVGYGFVFESFDRPGIDRNIGNIGVILVFAWLVNICIGSLYRRLRPARQQSLA